MRNGVQQFFSFPNPVNEVSARLVAGGVVVMATATIVFDQPWLTAIIAYGFVARVLTGPTASPLGQLVTRLVSPRLPASPKLVAGPPKRFAQGIGAVLSVTAAVLALGFGLTTIAFVLLGLLIAAAKLESVFGLCLGCKMFAVLSERGTASFKANDVAFEMLVETGQARPSPYMARAHWLYLDDLTQFPVAELRQYIAASHALVAKKLTKKVRRALGLATG